MVLFLFLLPYKNVPPTPLDVPAQQQGTPPTPLDVPAQQQGAPPTPLDVPAQQQSAPLTQQDVHVPVQQQSVFTTEPNIHVQAPPDHGEGDISEVRALLDIWQKMRFHSYTGGKHV